MIKAKKTLGQNFIISKRIVDFIINAGEIKAREINAGEKKEESIVLEIGPGKGTLTEELLKKDLKLIAIEKDDRLIPILREKFKKEISEKKLELIHGDVMDFLKKEDFLKTEKYKVIANIPYYITGMIIRGFLEKENPPTDMVLMVQKEVAERIIARDKKESILSISTKIYCDVELVTNVARGNFFPIPNVDSAVIKLKNIKNPFRDKNDREKFFKILKASFSQKRKKMHSNLKNVINEDFLNKIFQELKIDQNKRAEDISSVDWLKINTIIKETILK